MSTAALLPREAVRVRTLLVAVAIVVASSAIGFGATFPGGTRTILVVAAAVPMFAWGLYAPRQLLLALVGWVAVLGLARRVLAELAPVGQADPLLMVHAIALAVLVLAGAMRGAFRDRTRLANGTLVLSVLIVLGSVNPLQQPLLAGLTGLIYVLVPTLGFWVGRSLCDDRTLTRLLRLVAILSVGAALYGFSQTFRGFTTWDVAWVTGVRTTDYMALNVRGVVRPFGTFSSATEYVHYLGIGLIVWIAMHRTISRLLIALAVAGVLGTAIFLGAARGVVVMLLLALGAMEAVRRGLRPATSTVVAVVVLFGAVFVLGRVVPSPADDRRAAPLVQHQVEGLTDPLDPDSSTLLDHLALVRAGLGSAIENPLGHGVSTITPVGARFGAQALGTEADPSNVAVALGIPGSLAYAFVFFAGLWVAYQRARSRRDALSAIALGVLLFMGFQWLNGAEYSVAFMPWLLLGWLDRRPRDRARVGSAAPPGHGTFEARHQSAD